VGIWRVPDPSSIGYQSVGILATDKSGKNNIVLGKREHLPVNSDIRKKGGHNHDLVGGRLI